MKVPQTWAEILHTEWSGSACVDDFCSAGSDPYIHKNIRLLIIWLRREEFDPNVLQTPRQTNKMLPEKKFFPWIDAAIQTLQIHSLLNYIYKLVISHPKCREKSQNPTQETWGDRHRCGPTPSCYLVTQIKQTGWGWALLVQWFRISRFRVNDCLPPTLLSGFSSRPSAPSPTQLN